VGDINLFGSQITLNSDVLSGGGNISLNAVSDASNNKGIYISPGADIKTTGTGSITLTADARLADVDNNGYGIDIAASGTIIETDSGNITLTGTGTAVTGRTGSRGIVLQSDDTEIRSSSGTITLRDINPNNVSGTNSLYFAAGNKIGKGALASSSSNVVLEGDKINAQGLIETTGSLSILSNSSSFLSSVGTSNLTIASGLAGLTIGKSTNTENVIIGSALSVVGGITIYGGDININSSLETTASSSDINLLASRSVGSDGSAAIFTTAGGNLLIASDTDSIDGGNIRFIQGFNATTNGGDITLAGRDISGLGYAQGYSGTSAQGIRLSGTVTLNSAGGDITLRGRSFAGVVASGWGAWGVGLWTGIQSIDSGAGNIFFDGVSQSSGSGSLSNGVMVNAAATIQSASTSADAIKIIGNASTAVGGANYGIELAGGTKIYATGAGGGITIEADTGTSTLDFVLRPNTSILASSGPIKLISSGDALWTNGAIYLGSLTGTPIETMAWPD